MDHVNTFKIVHNIVAVTEIATCLCIIVRTYVHVYIYVVDM